MLLKLITKKQYRPSVLSIKHEQFSQAKKVFNEYITFDFIFISSVSGTVFSAGTKKNKLISLFHNFTRELKQVVFKHKKWSFKSALGEFYWLFSSFLFLRREAIKQAWFHQGIIFTFIFYRLLRIRTPSKDEKSI